MISEALAAGCYVASHRVARGAGVSLPDQIENEHVLANNFCASCARLEMHELPHQKAFVVL